MAEEKLRAALGGLLERMRVAGLKSFADELYAALAAMPEQASLRPEAVEAFTKSLDEHVHAAIALEGDFQRLMKAQPATAKQEDYPGQAFFHKHNPNIAATEHRAGEQPTSAPVSREQFEKDWDARHPDESAPKTSAPQFKQAWERERHNWIVGRFDLKDLARAFYAAGAASRKVTAEMLRAVFTEQKPTLGTALYPGFWTDKAAALQRLLDGKEGA